MIGHIALREVKDHVRTFRYLTLSLLAVFLMALGTYLNAKSYLTRVDAHSTMLREQERALSENASGANRLHGYGWAPKEMDVALRALRAPSVLSVWARGVDAALPGYWQFTSRGALDGPPLGDVTSSIGTLANIDYLFVTQVILGLLAVLLTFDTISGERESGTLRAVLAHPVPRNAVVIGKFVGALLTILPPVLLGTIISLLVAASAGVAFWRDGGLVWLGVLTLGAVGYLALFAALGVSVSATIRTAKTSLVVTLVLWASLVFVVPRLAALAASLAYPVELADTVQRRTESITTELEHERRLMLADTWIRSTGNSAIPESDFPVGLREAYDRVRLPLETQLFQKRRTLLRASLDERIRAEERRGWVFAVLARFSPAATLEQLANQITATGNTEARRWSRQVEAHQRSLESAAFDRVFGVEIFNPRIDLLISWSPDPRNPTSLPPDIRDLPRFRMSTASLYDALVPALGDLALLTVSASILLVGACVAFQRYDVRSA